MSKSYDYQMDKPIGETRLDRGVQGVIGKGIDRFEGPLKVSGKATYAYENLHGREVAFGYLVTSTIGSGKIVEIDTMQALSTAGVLTVITDENGPRAAAGYAPAAACTALSVPPAPPPTTTTERVGKANAIPSASKRRRIAR